ncbi:hypothetical protein E8E12_007757 [Didymella heteroderae]|uniref:Uncharacterized protein n=1 Tax=Didymella heteroderae TaxID=1769908 RepID=A0A9P5C1K1_9PLEO|nr:hypothetical protein E8E12_007757 [Didymella heteroderae]
MHHDKDTAVSRTTMPSYNHGKANEYIRASEFPQGSDMRSQPLPQRSFIEKLGLYNIGVMVFGAVASFLGMAFLAFLWSGSETARNGRPTPVLWFTIAETPNWATRVVTIGSVVIRIATAAQMGVFAALVAAWTLETTGASAENLPLLSIIRTVNNGPQSHVWNVFHSMRVGSKKFYSAMILLAITDALALQFTSTLLVTDFGAATVIPRASRQGVGYGVAGEFYNDTRSQNGRIQASTGINLNLAAPPAYPRFAEFSDPVSSHFGTDYADTGETYRALLPLGSSNAREPLRPYTWTQKSSGIWTDLKTTDANSTVDFGISATLCYVAADTGDVWVKADSTRDFSEPKNMSWIKDRWQYDTLGVRTMLGATGDHLSADKRGILNLHQPTNWTDMAMKEQGELFIGTSVLFSMGMLRHPLLQKYYPTYDYQLYNPQTAILTPYSPYISVHRTLSSIFQDIIPSTQNPALAFQALFSTMSSSAYYQMLPLFMLEDNATVATSETFSVPVQWTCFGIVMGLLAVHAVLVITAAVLFLSETDHSLLGNAWQAVAQVSSSDTMDTMHRASNMTDLEVKRLLRMNSFEDNEVVLRTGSDSGRSQAVYRRGTGNSR